MAGVLFVVHIPSARYERELRRKEQERLAKSTTATTEDEKDGDKLNGKSEETQPFVTPQPKKPVPKVPRSSIITAPDDDTRTTGDAGAAPTIKFIDQDGEEIPGKVGEDGEAKDDDKDGDEKGKDKKSNFLAEPFDRASALRKSWDGFKDLLGSSRKEKTAREEAAEKLTLTGNSSMEEVLKTIINEKRLHTAAWIETDQGNGFHIMFSIESGPICDDVIYMLSSWGVGQRFNSTISITSCTLYSQPPVVEEQQEEAGGEVNKNNDGSAWTTFLSTVRARLNVAQIVEEVKHDAQVSFDFVSMLAVASILAAFGLVEDSSVFLIASMLVSPLMGPIIAIIFGTVVKERQLQLIGLKNEIIGIMLTVTVGFVFGLIVCSIDDRYSVGEGITHEMLARCETHSLLVGIAIALPSGAAVAIAILGENIGSLVGVAISASLLPPAVNAGVLWALSCLYFLFGSEESRYGTLIKTQIYSENQGLELFTLGCMSISLTLLNIMCIYLGGVMFLIIKEVAPVVPKDQKQFWKHDIKIARDYNRTLHTNDGLSMSKQLIHELTTLHHNNDTMTGGLRGDYLLNSASKGGHQNTWSPRHNYHQRDHRPTIQELEALYLSLSANTTENQFHHSAHHAGLNYMNFDRFATSPTQHRRMNPPAQMHGGMSRGRFGESLRGASGPLSKILEDVAAGTSGAKAEGGHGHGQAHGERGGRTTRSYGLPSFKRSSKKFTVTPAYDPIQKE
ncbi:AGAP008879-PA-like protein [Anopheles sinensis]|uniref:AGAP008879-PA-like protein n=1 Tax=Anopheles sinensis TaxID=74873 RepID=A0A084VYM9_ANOSI|nr:AGAP008879-PA-like protein [Anopheles sinensis]